MKRFQRFLFAATGMAGLGLFFPSGAMAAPAKPSPAPTPAISDVTLGKGGSLTGQVVDSKGAPVPETPVTVHTAGTQVVSTVTDAQGNFSVTGLKGGVVETNAAGCSNVFRCWTPEGSPPCANKPGTPVECRPIIRGQGPHDPGFHWPTGQLGCGFPPYRCPPPPPICRHPCS